MAIVTRRELLRWGGLLPAGAFLAWGYPGVGSAGSGEAPVASGNCAGALQVIEDSTLEASRRFAAALGALGANSIRHAGDVSSLAHLGIGSWGQQVFGCVAGLGTWTHAFIVERLAWTADLRVIGRGIHRVDEGRAARHDLSGLLQISGRSGAEAAVGREWPCDLAVALSTVRLAGHRALSPLEPAVSDGALVSWVLVPRKLIRA